MARWETAQMSGFDKSKGRGNFSRVKKDDGWTSANAFVAHVVDTALAAVDSTPQPVQFRPSSFPHCALLHSLAAYDDVSASAYMELQKKKTYGFDFYVSVGTAVHEVIQRYIAEISTAGTHVFATWVCTSCRHAISWAMRPAVQTCPKCKKGSLRYEELTLEGTQLSGHADMVLCQKIKKNGKIKRLYHLLEFKTTSEDTLRDAVTGAANPKGYLPQEKHTVQVGIYTALLRRMGIRVSTVSLIYISRDKAAQSVTAPPLILTKKVNGTYIDFYDDHLTRAEEAFAAMQRHAQLGSNFDATSFVSDLWSLRPCKSQEEYEAYMAKGFFNAACPFAASGACWKRNVGTTPGRLLLKAASQAGVRPLQLAVKLAACGKSSSTRDAG